MNRKEKVYKDWNVISPFEPNDRATIKSFEYDHDRDFTFGLYVIFKNNIPIGLELIKPLILE